MIDRIRSEIQSRLDELQAETDKLRQALAALGSGDGRASSARGGGARRGSRRSTSTSARGATSSGARATGTRRTRTNGATATSTRRSAASSSRRGRSASGATKRAVLEALSGSESMTAGEVASATGLGRASVSTTLSKLSKSGEVVKATRGYRLGSG
jgi:DNA-binding transcriptional ArsR family regulator